MNLGNITGQARSGKAGIFGEFHIEFPSTTFGPYNYIFTRENLYFCEELGDRGASLFPLKEIQFDNTEIFLERDDIVVCCGVRGSFSGQEKLFVEFINLETQAKYRFFPEEVSLIYHTQNSLICSYRDENIWKKVEFSLTDFSLISETKEHISAFFKLLYHHNSKEFSRLIFNDEGYFFDMPLANPYHQVYFTPTYFQKNNFKLEVTHTKKTKVEDNYFIEEEKKYIDVWEASLIGEM